MKLKASKDKVIIKTISSEEKSEGGIYLPEASREKPSTGIVVASGSDEYSEGDIVLYVKYGGNDFTFEGLEYRALEGKEIICKVIE